LLPALHSPCRLALNFVEPLLQLILLSFALELVDLLLLLELFQILPESVILTEPPRS
jgi:hypothetical protein